MERRGNQERYAQWLNYRSSYFLRKQREREIWFLLLFPRLKIKISQCTEGLYKVTFGNNRKIHQKLIPGNKINFFLIGITQNIKAYIVIYLLKYEERSP